MSAKLADMTCKINIEIKMSNKELCDAISQTFNHWQRATWKSEKEPIWKNYLILLEEQRIRATCGERS